MQDPIQSSIVNLSELETGNVGIVVKLTGRGAFKRRLTEMGFTRGAQVEVIKNAPLRDPIEYKILNYNISLRRAEAEMIEVSVPVTEAGDVLFLGSENAEKFNLFVQKPSISVALVGNPNAGKTTLFNSLSHANEHVGNYSGVTVDAKHASFKHKGYVIDLVDLPGTYSISSFSPEEIYVRTHLLEAMPDLVLNVVDAGNLHRNLFLTTQLIDMDLQIVMALNMYDDLKNRGDKLDFDHLGRMMGIPIVPTIASKNQGLIDLLDAIVDTFEGKNDTIRHIHIQYGKPLDKAIAEVQYQIKIPKNQELTNRISSRFMAIKLLEKDKEIAQALFKFSNQVGINETVDHWVNKIESHLKEDTHSLISEAKYAYIRGALKETLKENKAQVIDKTRKIDKIITHKYLGFPIFFGLLWLMFQSTFTIGNYPMEWIEMLVSYAQQVATYWISPGPFKDLLVDGIIGGVGGVVVFLPNILLLFFFISLMEDTGYMARAAFIMDKLMHTIGLHGKSFIPLIMGFGCNVPAIMATRTIENRSERILTILINPLMSCSARLPVYVLIASAVFPNHAGNAIFVMYLSGIVLAGMMSILFKKLFFRKVETPFVMELPPYRMPVMRGTLRHMWHKGAEYLNKMGGVILIASILIWALGYFPLDKPSEKLMEAEKVNLEQAYQMQEISLQYKDSLSQKISQDYYNQRLAQSYIGRFGKLIEPVIAPLGFDWRIGVSLISGMPAKEIIVSTMGVLFKDSHGETVEMQDKIRSQVYQTGPKAGAPLFNGITAFSFLLFVLIYFPCVATLSAVRKETGSWKWPAFMLFYTSILAYSVSFLFYQISNLIL